jgi:hypothetical protein
MIYLNKSYEKHNKCDQLFLLSEKVQWASKYTICLSSAESIRDKRKAGLEIDAEQLASYSQRSGGSGHLPRVRVPPPPPPRMEGCVWLHRILSLQGINFDSQEQESQCTTVLGVSIRLGSMRPRRPLVRRRRARLSARIGSFLQNFQHIDGKKTTVVRALNAFQRSIISTTSKK